MIWVASGTEPLRRFDGESWTSIRLSQFGGSDINTSSLFESQDGTLWVGGSGSVLFAYRDGNWQQYRHPEIPLPRTRVSGILQAQDGALWIAGLAVYAVLASTDALTTLPTGLLGIKYHVFVIVLFAAGIIAGMLTLVLNSVFQREDNAKLRKLEERVRALEAKVATTDA